MDIFKKKFSHPLKSLMNRKDGEVAAAIAAALELYEGSGVHDKESYIITIRKR